MIGTTWGVDCFDASEVAVEAYMSTVELGEQAALRTREALI